MKLIKDIKNCLNNEHGGPNVEQMVGLGISTVIVSGIWLVGRSLYSFYYTTPTVPTIAVPDKTEEGIVIGYKKR